MTSRAGTESSPVRLVLASGSPRRAEVLQRLGLPFTVRPSGVDEALGPDETPAAAVERLARAKASAVRDRLAEAAAEEGADPAGGDTLVLACDTLVALGDRALEKPADTEEAVAMLRRLAGGEHAVHTGVALAGAGRVESAVETTRVRFRRADEDELREYAATGEPMDKAGAYVIQAMGSALVEGIEGDFFNVMGLPVGRFLELLRRFGWRYAFGEVKPLDGG